ncbi:TolB-like translocation protein [Streptomyces piniterrae]|uniref:TolB-like translocation protein n=1 Tax=Streptomyces piniterrae TaxID=2571125 RepID=A0A4U0NX05_9ACTN|nr:PD40 domain-containing protein [Streptomyces piniterrae]TJZ58692.1 TolB-like translocation protein [Streptomyces piniterrae]
MRHRATLLTVVTALLATTAFLAVDRAADRAADRERPHTGQPAIQRGELDLRRPGRLVFRSLAWGPQRDRLATVPLTAPGGPRTAAPRDCLRFHAAAGTGICLRKKSGVIPGHEAVLLDARGRAVRHFPVPGIPTRARVSPSGRLVAWTVFVSGDSYAGGAFSTRTAVYDTRTGTLHDTLEDFTVLVNGRRHQAVDHNFWGVTFAADDNTYYATLGTGGRTYLVRGDLARRSLTTVRENAECPSLSPDGTRIAFKKRIRPQGADAPWRLYVLDLRSGRETPLAERASVDDQALWLDGRTLLYALPGDFGADLWSVPANGGGHPRKEVASAVSPAVTGPVSASAPAGTAASRGSTAR